MLFADPLSSLVRQRRKRGKKKPVNARRDNRRRCRTGASRGGCATLFAFASFKQVLAFE